MMEAVGVYQEQIQKAEVDAERRTKKVRKIEQIIYEGKDKMWSICARLAEVPAIAKVVGHGITQSQTESNLVNIRTLLPELDRYLPVLMRLFASVVPEDARHSGPEILPPWSSPVQRPIVSIVDRYTHCNAICCLDLAGCWQREKIDRAVHLVLVYFGELTLRRWHCCSYMKPLKAASDGTRQISVRAMSPDDPMMQSMASMASIGDSDVDGAASSVADHGDVELLRRQAGIEAGTPSKKRGGKTGRKDSKGRGGGRGGRRGRGRGGPGRSRRPKNLSLITG